MARARGCTRHRPHNNDIHRLVLCLDMVLCMMCVLYDDIIIWHVMYCVVCCYAMYCLGHGINMLVLCWGMILCITIVSFVVVPRCPPPVLLLLWQQVFTHARRVTSYPWDRILRSVFKFRLRWGV